MAEGLVGRQPIEDPTARKPIEDTSGYVVLEDGRRVPTLDTWWNQQGAGVPGFGAEQQRTRLGQQYQTGAQAVTNAFGDVMASPVIAAEKLGFVSPDTAAQYRNVDRTIAGALIPQTLTQAGIDAGMLLAGGAGGAMKLGRGLSAALTTLGGTAGGLAGGVAEYGTKEGMITGSGQGLLESGAAIGASELFDLARKIGPSRVRQKMNIQAAAQTGQALEQMPSLKGVFRGIRDERGLRDLVLGVTEEVLPDGTKVAWQKGHRLLSQYAEEQNKKILSYLPPGFSPTFPDAMNPGTFTTWAGSKRSLSELGQKAFGTGAEKSVLEPTIKGIDSKLLYRDTIRAIQRELTLLDPSGEALRLFNDGQQVQESGRAVLKLLRSGFTGEKGARRPWYNHDAVQNMLGNKQAALMKKIPPDDFWMLANANALTPSTIGQVDVFQPHGLLSQVAGIAPGPAGSYARFHAGWPDVVGNRTSMPPGVRTGFQLGVAQGMSPLGDYLNQSMQGPGLNIPGLKPQQ